MITVSSHDLAAQAASLINKGGQLRHTLTAYSVLNSSVRYLIELDRHVLIGIIGLDVRNPKVTELKHLCVHTDYRNRGVGRKLLERGIAAASTDLVYGLVRSDNIVNIRNNLRVGLIPVGKKLVGNHSLIVFANARRSLNGVGKAISAPV